MREFVKQNQKNQFVHQHLRSHDNPKLSFENFLKLSFVKFGKIFQNFDGEQQQVVKVQRVLFV